MYLVPPPDNYYEIEASEIRWAKAEYTVHRQQCRQEKKKKDKRHEKYLPAKKLNPWKAEIRNKCVNSTHCAVWKSYDTSISKVVKIRPKKSPK